MIHPEAEAKLVQLWKQELWPVIWQLFKKKWLSEKKQQLFPGIGLKTR